MYSEALAEHYCVPVDPLSPVLRLHVMSDGAYILYRVVVLSIDMLLRCVHAWLIKPDCK